MERYAILRKVFFVFACVGVCTALLGLLPQGSDSWSTLARAEEKEKTKVNPKFVGVRLCRVCHKSPKSGDQYSQWKETKHAQAFKTLASAESKALATKLGIKDPQKDMKCLKCHVTAADKPELSKRLNAADGVQCESCHGPGQHYSKRDIFEKGRQVAMEHGLVIPDKALCVRCHNKESPTFPGEFNFEEMWKKVLHPNPEKKKGSPD